MNAQDCVRDEEPGPRCFDRRRFIRVIGSAGIAGVAGCLGGGDGPTTTSSGDGTETTSPGDGTGTTSPGNEDGPAADLPTPVGLRVECEQDPNNLHPETTPRFSWEFPTDPHGIEQTAYRIRVATDTEAMKIPH